MRKGKCEICGDACYGGLCENCEGFYSIYGGPGDAKKIDDARKDYWKNKGGIPKRIMAYEYDNDNDDGNEIDDFHDF